VTTGPGKSWQVMEFRKTILRACIVMENSKGHGKLWKSWKSHGKVVHKKCREISTSALRNSVMNVSSECVDSFHYYNQLELLLLIPVCIRMSCFVYFGKNVVPIGHGNSFRLVLESHGK